MEENADFPEQTKVVHAILEYLIDKKTLNNEPKDVEMITEGRRSITPCRRGTEEIDLKQVKWAKNNGKWWFSGPITEMRISLKDKTPIKGADVSLLKRLAESADFELKIL
jgi:hypothetical protein